MRTFTIRDKTITDNSPAYVCAEISHNHLGSLDLAQEMIRLAAEAGATAVKVQKRGPKTYAALRHSGDKDLVEYANMRAAREFDFDEYCLLARYASEHDLAFVVTAFDHESADFVRGLKPDAIKIASGDITNTPLLRHVANLGLPMIVSTGGCDMEDVEAAHKVLTEVGAAFCLLHCTSQYPVQTQNMQLAVIQTYRRAFPDTVIGFSSHVHRDNLGVPEAIAAAFGAKVFEAHLTLTPGIGTGEHAFALTPVHLEELCRIVRKVPAALGDGTKYHLDAESAGILRLGKHLAYARALQACHEMVEDDFVVVGPGRGVPPNQLEGLIGGVLTRVGHAGADMQAMEMQWLKDIML